MEPDSIPLPPQEAAAVAATIDSVVSPGATLSGRRRRELGELVRAAGEQAGNEGRALSSDVERHLIWRFVVDAHAIRADDVAAAINSGVPAPTYVEILSLAARLIAVDTLHFALGHAAAPFPEPVPGQPTGSVATEARLDRGWVPTVGPASPPNALSLLPDDDRAMHALHSVLYLSIHEMADSDIERGVHRTQMELVAARTSLLNECFF